MSEPPPNARPRQVTLAAWLTMVGSGVVVLLVFEQISGLQTIETRDAIERFLAEPPGSDLGVGVDGVLVALRTLGMVAAGCATAAGILGYHVLKRSRSARLALTLVAVPLFVAGMVTGGFVSSLVAAAAAMLWLQPSRDWFDGVTRRVPPAAPAPAPAVAPARTPVATPPAAGNRPPAVLWACVLTWVGAGLTLAGTVASGVLLGLQPDALLDEVHRQNPELDAQGISDGLLVGVTYAMLAGFALWCVAASIVAFLVLRGLGWARVVLVVSAATAGVACLLGTLLGAFLLAAVVVTSAGTVALLLRPEVRTWFASARG